MSEQTSWMKNEHVLSVYSTPVNWEWGNKPNGWKTNQQTSWMKNEPHSHAYCYSLYMGMGKQTSWMKNEPTNQLDGKRTTCPHIMLSTHGNGQTNKPIGWKTNHFLNICSIHDNWKWANKPVGWKTNQQTNWIQLFSWFVFHPTGLFCHCHV